MVASGCNPSIWRVVTRGSGISARGLFTFWAQGQPELYLRHKYTKNIGKQNKMVVYDYYQYLERGNWTGILGIQGQPGQLNKILSVKEWRKEKQTIIVFCLQPFLPL